MATAARSRANHLFTTMPGGPAENSQQPKGSPFAASHLYPNKSIWNASSSFGNPRDRAIGVNKDADESQTGPSGLAPNYDADMWGSIPWKPENPSRSVTNSPGRMREAVISNASTLYDHPPAIGTKKNVFGVNNLQDDSDPYNIPSYPPRHRLNAAEAAYFASYGALPAREGSMPPSRHSQGSPALKELYQSGHTPSNSIHSQNQMPGHPLSFTNQAANQRAMNLNKSMEDEVSLRFARQLSMETPVSGGQSFHGQSFNPASQPFQPWNVDGSASRLGGNAELGVELAAQLAMKRHSIDKISPSPNDYRLDSGTSPRTFAPISEAWPTRPSSRDPRTVDYERRASLQFPSNYPQFYAGQYAYGTVPPTFQSGFPDPYSQSFSQNFRPALIPGYAIPQPMHSTYQMSPVMSPARPSREQDPGKGMRSVVLDEFRTNSRVSKRFELKDIYHHVVEFSGDQHGSRFIQQKLETANSDEKEQIFQEIEPNAVQLMKDVFGNYVVQKFFEHGNQLQKKLLADKMKGKVPDLSLQVYACRVVQKALEHVLVEQQAQLTKELEPEILKVIKDQNGNHVVQKVIELVPRKYLGFLMDALRGQVTTLASHMYGCRVIQRMLEHGNEDDKAEIMSEIHASAGVLIIDQYGNYVSQHVIQHGQCEDREKMIRLVLAQLLTFSKHKFASNVVEKCIEYGSDEQRTFIRRQLTTAGPDGTSPLQFVMRDQFANYVLQKLLSLLEGAELDAVVEEIKPYFYALKKSGASRQLQALEKLINPGKGEQTSTQSDSNSTAAETPVLTNETNSPQSNSPPSTHVSAVNIQADNGAKKTSGKAAEGIALRVQDGEA